MTRFKDIQVDPAAATVDVGAGLTWDQVYAALEPYNITVIGGRIPGIGVAGAPLAEVRVCCHLISRRAMKRRCREGYSWKSSQYGLTIDNIVGYELVLPNGTITS
jgi:FAD/FMN-containing dehydrogenase